MKTLNIRLLGTLAIAVLFLWGGSYFLHAFQVQRHAGAYLREARRAQEENKPREAVRHFRRYVKLAPHDTEGLALYGLQLAELDQLQPAYLILDQALRREPGREEWRRRLVETALELERYSDARANLEGHLLKNNPNDADLLAQLGRCHIALGENDAAIKAFEAAIEADPQRLEPYLLLAGLHKSRLKDAAEADRCIDRMVAANTEDFRAYLIRGEWKLNSQNRDGLPANGTNAAPATENAALQAAEADAGRALELAPDAADSLLFAARVAAIGGKYDDARSFATRGLEALPRASGPYILLAEIETAAGARAAALDWLRKGTGAVPLDPELHWTLARMLVESEQAAEALAEIEILREQAYPAARLSYLEARLAMAERKWPEAIRVLEDSRPGLANWPEIARQVDCCLGECYERLGNPDRQLVALRRAVSTDPSYLPARLGLARALVATGRGQEAKEHFGYVASRPGAPAIAGLTLTQLMIVENLRREPAQRDWTTINQNLDQLEAALPGSAQIALLRAEILVAQDKQVEASELLDAARQRDPSQIEVLAAQVALAEQADNTARADELIAAAKDSINDPVALAVLKGRTLLRRKGADAAAAVKQVWQESESLSASDRGRLAGNLSAFALVAEDLALAAELGTLAAKSAPNDLRIRELLLDVAILDQKYDRLESLVADIHRIEGAGALWHYGRALQNASSAEGANSADATAAWNKALDEITSARTQRPGWSKPVLLAAQIHDRQGNTSRAADAYLEAISLGERSPSAIARTVTLLFEQKRFVDADQVVRRIQEQQGLFTGNLTRLAAETSIRLEEFDRASNLANSFAVDSDRFEDHVWAGQMLGLLGHYDEAEARLRRAIEINPTSGEPRIALVRVLSQAGRVADAETAITEAAAAVAPNEAPVTVALAYETLGRTVEAEERFRKALAQSPDNAFVVRRVVEFFLKNRNTVEAEPHLRRFVKAELKVSDDDRCWARRSLAILLGTRGGQRAMTEALGLLDENQQTGPASSADVRARAIVLALQPSADLQKQAREALKQLLADERTASSEDRFLLAELLRRSGDLAGAADELRKALAVQPDQSRYVAAYVEILLERGETSEARLWVERLKTIAPGEMLTADLDARVMFAANRFDAVTALLTQFATSSSDGDKSNDRGRWAAEQLTQFAVRLQQSERKAESETLAKAAESLFQQHIQARPAESLELARFHARLGRIDQALTALASPPEGARPESIEAVAVAIMTNPSATADQLSQLQSRLEESVRRHGQALPLLIVSADLFGWRGDLASAESRYRQLLDRNGDDVRVLNNLALVLALGKRRYDDGLALIEKAIEIAGPHGALLDTRGLVQLAAGRTKQAQADFEQAIGQKSGAERYLHLAAAQWQAREQDRAQQSLKRAEELGLAWANLHPLERPLLADLRTETK